jgi:hypothetical protein
MGLTVHPEATYVLYPFNVPNATARLDLGGQPMAVGSDQLPGVCLDYFTVQGWVDLSNEELGVTVAMPENPMVQLGDFHFAHNQAECTLERAMLLGWVTNNYWETNFRPHQPGQVGSGLRSAFVPTPRRTRTSSIPASRGRVLAPAARECLARITRPHPARQGRRAPAWCDPSLVQRQRPAPTRRNRFRDSAHPQCAVV